MTSTVVISAYIYGVGYWMKVSTDRLGTNRPAVNSQNLVKDGKAGRTVT